MGGCMIMDDFEESKLIWGAEVFFPIPKDYVCTMKMEAKKKKNGDHPLKNFDSETKQS